MSNVLGIKQLDVKNKRVILRVDFNVPIVEGKITDNSRIVKVLPTIKYLISQNAKIIILSHFGRPKGQDFEGLSLKNICDELSRLLNIKIAFNDPLSEITLMENIRFYKEEEQGDLDFAKKLASLGDIYINDAFSCSHRNHASITGIAKFLPSAAGLLLESEIDNLEKILSTPKSPFVSIVGGAKISTKLDLLYHLITKSDLLVLGGGMANSFLKAKGYDVGNSLYEEDLIDKAIDLINKSEQNHCKLILPIDVVVSRSVNDPDFRIISPDDILADEMILDIGPKTIQLILQELLHAKTLVWNGPMGAFEFKPYDLGTINLAKHVAQLTKNKQLTSVAGGGDIVSALTMSELIDDFSYVSTAGGAFLEWLEGKGLCGIEALKK